MRYFFHVVDKYGLSPDRTGYEHPDQDAAVLHARRIAAELAKAGECFRSSVVLVARGLPFPDRRRVAIEAPPPRGDLTTARRRIRRADFLPPASTEKP